MDIQLHYTIAGQGFPLVMLHGNGEDHTYFKHQMAPFSERYQVIALETRGHGQSPRGTAPFTLEQFAEDLKAFLDSREIRRCHLLGFSDGANIALLFALKYPEYVEKLVLNGADLSPSGVKLSIQAPIILGWGLLQVIRRLDKRTQPKWELLDLMTTQPHIDPEALSVLPMPTLVVAGKRDMIRDKHTRLIAKSIPDSQLAILPGDHFVARQNWQAFNPVVLDFLSE
ncbi:alpha/beta hydrolase [Oscillospiraceae bacterium 44-34]